jgi:D-alanyl-lipoteichoic acid acyltransferase DltB (MBOAT superfamily)
MLFNSYDFIFIFVPACLLAYSVAIRRSVRAAGLVLVGFSLIYFGWWNAAYLPLLIGLAFFNYTLGTRLLSRPRRPLLIAGLALNLAVLGFFKYTDFFIRTANQTIGTHIGLLNILLPLGISFFIFQKVVYLVDCYRQRILPHTYLDHLLYVSFFPQLIAGPIVHPSELLPQLKRLRSLTVDNFSVGIAFFAIGLFKKVCIADYLALLASPVFAAAEAAEPISFVEAWIGVLAYTFQIYFDFSGYCDMAIGLARLFGVRLPINFNSPYQSTSIIEFWRRWHMTLSRFLRDYLYIPLGGNRRGHARAMANLMTVMLLGGLWHGASWLFVIWGGLHGIYLMINHQIRQSRPQTSGPIEAALGWVATFLAVVVAWVFFRAPTLDGAMRMLETMAGRQGIAIPSGWPFADLATRVGIAVVSVGDLALYGGFQKAWLVPLCFAIVILLPNSQTLMRRYAPALAPDRRTCLSGPRWIAWRMTPAWAVLTAVLLFVSLMSLSNVSEFIYYQF